MIRIANPFTGDEEIKAVSECIRSGWITVKSEWVSKFEEGFSNKVSGTTYGVAVNSGTSALHLAMVGLGIGDGDEVIVPDLAMIAVPNAVRYTGASPVLIDATSESDWNLNPALVEKAVGKRTKAIITVHTYGYPVEMDRILKIAQKHKLIVIEDSAEAMGARYKGKLTGSMGKAGCFSLYVNKTITTGQGGMITTSDEKLHKKLVRLRLHDFGMEKHFKHDSLGFSYGMSGLEASFGLAQLKRYEKSRLDKIRIAEYYRRRLGNIKELIWHEEKENVEPSYWMSAVVFKSRSLKDHVARSLFKKDIETREFFLPIHKQRQFQGSRFFALGKKPISDFLTKRGLLLPSGPNIDSKDLQKVADAVIAAIENY